jgi:hypothetical protein
MAEASSSGASWQSEANKKELDRGHVVHAAGDLSESLEAEE